MPDTTTDVDLRVFCKTEPHDKYGLIKPFVRSGWRYATDGRIAVRLSDDGPNTEGKFPKIESVFEDFLVCDQPLPALVPVKIDCRRCIGFGRIPLECPTCYGESIHEYDCGDEHECGACNGKGKIPGPNTCFFCNGAKRITVRKGVPLDGHPNGAIELVEGRFDPWYLYLIESRYQKVRHAAAMFEGRLCFTAEGGVQIILAESFPE